MISQLVWTLIIWVCAIGCFEGFREDSPPVRFIGFIGMVIAIGWGIHELNQLAILWNRMPVPIDRTTGYEIIIPLALCIWKVRAPRGQAYVTGR